LTLRGTNVERDRQDLLGSNPVDGLGWLRCLDFAPQTPATPMATTATATSITMSALDNPPRRLPDRPPAR
jgi:hypothetical protein